MTRAGPAPPAHRPSGAGGLLPPHRLRAEGSHQILTKASAIQGTKNVGSAKLRDLQLSFQFPQLRNSGSQLPGTPVPRAFHLGSHSHPTSSPLSQGPSISILIMNSKSSCRLPRTCDDNAGPAVAGRFERSGFIALGLRSRRKRVAEA